MIIINFLSSLLFWIYIELAVFFLCLISIILFFWPSFNRTAIYSLSRWLLRAIFWFCRITIKVDNRTGSPIRGVVSSSREGLIDPLYILAYFPARFRFVVDRELFMIPFFARILSVLGAIPVPKKRSSYKRFFQQIKTSIAAGETLLFFPGDKNGPARIAQMTGSKLFKVDLAGGRKVMPMESMILQSGSIKVTIEEANL